MCFNSLQGFVCLFSFAFDVQTIPFYPVGPPSSWHLSPFDMTLVAFGTFWNMMSRLVLYICAPRSLSPFE